MKNLEKHLVFTFAVILAVIAPFSLFAQDTLALGTPSAYTSPEAVAAVTTALTVLLSYASGAVPFLKKIPHTTVRAIASGILVLLGTGAFKFGFLNSESIEFVKDNIAATFGYGTFVYLGLQGLLFLGKKMGWVSPNVEFKSLKPAAKAAKSQPKTKA